jgi:hypothetical protein
VDVYYLSLYYAAVATITVSLVVVAVEMMIMAAIA